MSYPRMPSTRRPRPACSPLKSIATIVTSGSDVFPTNSVIPVADAVCTDPPPVLASSLARKSSPNRSATLRFSTVADAPVSRMNDNASELPTRTETNSRLFTSWTGRSLCVTGVGLGVQLAAPVRATTSARIGNNERVDCARRDEKEPCPELNGMFTILPHVPRANGPFVQISRLAWNEHRRRVETRLYFGVLARRSGPRLPNVGPPADRDRHCSHVEEV